MKKDTSLSKSGSMKGYSLKVWLVKNKNTLKTLAAAVVAIGTFFIPSVESIELSASLAVVTGSLSKLGLDALDFYLSDVWVKVDPPII